MKEKVLLFQDLSHSSSLEEEKENFCSSTKLVKSEKRARRLHKRHSRVKFSFLELILVSQLKCIGQGLKEVFPS
uniref:Uncharacterized protein n=1 Tax=Nelumbo nucifera TaxID=4432 RepID=A0A822YSX9_NELNU|nr:TPA_asm: hypothetical protein HUJ06_006267 [Nelumbo nucifera]